MRPKTMGQQNVNSVPSLGPLCPLPEAKASQTDSNPFEFFTSLRHTWLPGWLLFVMSVCARMVPRTMFGHLAKCAKNTQNVARQIVLCEGNLSQSIPLAKLRRLVKFQLQMTRFDQLRDLSLLVVGCNLRCRGIMCQAAAQGAQAGSACHHSAPGARYTWAQGAWL